MMHVTSNGSVSEETQTGIVVGTAGFKYEDWRGPFYPRDLPDRSWLEYYADRFSLVELDFTYYHLPSPRTMASFVRRTRADFRFSVKAHRSLTHDQLSSPEILRAGDRFREALDPLVESSQLSAVLLQFPYRFRPCRESCERILLLKQVLAGLPLVVEFRRGEWVARDTMDRTLDWLTRQGLGYCCVDEPRLRGLVPPVSRATSDVGYVRFHGRNAEKWWQHDQAWERYNYLYTGEELAQWIQPVLDLQREAGRVIAVFNNHYGGNAVVNADTFRNLLRSASDEVEIA